MALKLRLFNPSEKLVIPAHFRCPISLDLMSDPVTLSTGITYDRQSIEAWLDANARKTCPVTNQILTNSGLTPNHTLRKLIQDWCVANKALGIERIPTPHVPITSTQVFDILSDVELACLERDCVRILHIVAKIKKLCKESERNKQCISSNGSAKILARAFGQFVSNEKICSEVLSVLTYMFPLDGEACRQIGSPEASNSLVSILRFGDLSARLNAVLVIKEIVENSEKQATALAEMEGLVEAIVRVIKDPISPRATKASLVATYHLVSSGERAILRFVDMGLVSLLIEVLVDSDKSKSEKALAVLDVILSNDKAREMAHVHELAIPVLVKKMFRVSDKATEFAISAIWKLICKDCEEEKGRKSGEVALSVGAFQKLLLLLQLGCNGEIKEKASDLLKILNRLRGKGECIESVDLRRIKRHF